MSGDGPGGTEGYAQEADALARQYESIPFTEAHRPILHLLPPAPARVPDIGAGTGRDGILAMTLRHRPVPPGRRMFDVTAAETVALAEPHRLACIWRTEHGDGRLARPGVSWDRLVFRRPD